MAVDVLEPCESFGAGMCLLAVRNSRDAQGHVHGPHAVKGLQLALDRGVVRVEESGGLYRPKRGLADALQVIAKLLRRRSCVHLLRVRGMGLHWQLSHGTVARHAGVIA